MTTLRIENIATEPVQLVAQAARMAAPERADARVIPIDELAPGDAVRIELAPDETLLLSQAAP